MANTKAAQKEIRASRRKATRNKPVRTLCKTTISKAENDVFGGELESARGKVLLAVRTLDKAAEKGIIHPNSAARRKSRLVRKLNAAQKAQGPKAASPETPK